MTKIKDFFEVNELIETIKSKGIKIHNEEKVKESFNKLIDDINDLIDNYIKNNNIVSKKELLKEMSLPNNFLDLKW